MLTEADRALWRDFLANLQLHRAELEADDLVPMVLVFARVRRRNDDAAMVGLGVPDVALLTRPDVAGEDVALMLEAAAVVARKGER